MDVRDHCEPLSRGDMLNWYRIESILGRGGFGVTYLAHDTNLNTPVAIKEYLPNDISKRVDDSSVSPRTNEDQSVFSWGLDRFVNEARTLVRFKHPNIVRVMSVFQANNTAYMVMEFEKGQNLKEFLQHPRNNTETVLKSVTAPIIDGLREIHRHGFIHRDIKPANIYIREDNTPVLLDFGSARQIASSTSQVMTVMVTVGYAPLEQYGGSPESTQGPWTDIYALSAVLYYAITGQAPVESTVRASAVFNNHPDPLPSILNIANDNYSTNFLSGIDWGLRFKISERPENVDQWSVKLFNQSTDTVLKPRNSTPPPAKASFGAPKPLPVASNVVTPIRARTNDTPSPQQKRPPREPWDTQLSTDEPVNPSRAKKSRIRKKVGSKRSAWLKLLWAFPALLLAYGGYFAASLLFPPTDNSQSISRQANEAEAKRLAEQQRLAQEAEAKRIAEQQRLAEEAEAKRVAEQQRLAEEAEAKRIAEQQRLAEEAEAKRVAEQQRLAEEAEAKRIAEQQRLAEEAEAKQIAEQQRLAQEAEAKRIAEQQRLAEEAEAKRIAEQQRLAQEAEAKRLAEQQRLAEEAEAKRVAEQQRLAEEAEAKRVVEQQRLAEEAEAKRIAEQQRLAQEAEAKRIAEQQRLAEEAEAKRIAEQQRLAEEAEATRLAEQQRLAQEAEAKRLAEQRRLAAEASAARQNQTRQTLTDGEIQQAFELLEALKRAVERRDMPTINQLVVASAGRRAFFEYAFANFSKIDTSLESISVQSSKQTVTATLKINQMTSNNGSISQPAAAHRLIQLQTIKNNDGWSRISW